MGKQGGGLTPKAIANRQKAKGLQKLRWYCQMCQKQCRDENGFKCHLMSESHQRQLLIVAESPDKFVDDFSDQFLKSFLEVLRRRFGTTRVFANRVYQEYIADKEHLHMNATKWHTLTNLVKFLGKEGYCTVDETPKGWFIQYIDRDPEAVKRQKLADKWRRMEKDEEQRQAQIMQMQIERDKAAKGEAAEDEPEYTELKRADEAGKIAFAINTHVQSADTKPKEAGEAPAKAPLIDKTAELAAKVFGVSSSAQPAKQQPEKRKLSNLELLKMELEANKKAKKEAQEKLHKDSDSASSAPKKKSARKDYWLYPDIIVKILHKTLGDGKFYKRKGVVVDVIDKYTAKIRLLDSKTTLKLDQDYLETVIPSIGHPVLVVNGEFRNREGVLKGIDTDKFCARVKVAGHTLDLPYEDVCKLHVEA